jgi:hypothetical protein
LPTLSYLSVCHLGVLCYPKPDAVENAFFGMLAETRTAGTRLRVHNRIRRTTSI